MNLSLNISDALSMISDYANQNCTNKGFENQFVYLSVNEVKKLEKGLEALKKCNSITFKRVNIFSEAEFEITNPNSVDSQELKIPYINGIEKFDGFSNTNFNLADLLVASFDTEDLNKMYNKIPTATSKSIHEIKEREFKDEIFGSDFEPDIDDPTLVYPDSLIDQIY